MAKNLDKVKKDKLYGKQFRKRAWKDKFPARKKFISLGKVFIASENSSRTGIEEKLDVKTFEYSMIFIDIYICICKNS